jgi:hypothetical protein
MDLQPLVHCLVPEINLVLDQDLAPCSKVQGRAQPADMEILVDPGILQYQELTQMVILGQAEVAQIHEAVTAQILQGVQVKHIK